MSGHNFERLKEHILSLSVSDDFQQAKAEWTLERICIADHFEYCSCGQQIKEMCYIRNRRNNNITRVGNVCINRFLEIKTGNIFAGLKRIMSDPKANANIDLINYAKEMGLIFGDKEYNFLTETARRMSLSPRQRAWKEKVNRRIVKHMVNENMISPPFNHSFF